MAWTLSFTVRIYRSMLGTCSFSDIVFNPICISERCWRSGSNSPSIRIILMTNPLCWYILCTCFMHCANVDILRFGIISAVPNRMKCDVVRNMGMQLMNNMSADMVTSWYCVMMSIGTAVIIAFTLCGVLRVVFPFNDPMSGPKMSSAMMMLYLFMGLSPNSECSMYCMKSWVLGHPMIFCIFRAMTAREYAWWVYMAFLLATVVTNTVPPACSLVSL